LSAAVGIDLSSAVGTDLSAAGDCTDLSSAVGTDLSAVDDGTELSAAAGNDSSQLHSLMAGQNIEVDSGVGVSDNFSGEGSRTLILIAIRRALDGDDPV